MSARRFATRLAVAALLVLAAQPLAGAEDGERKASKVTPGAPSRWSNAGAMTPIESEVPVTAPLPERATPVAAGAKTPGQALTGEEDQLAAHLSLYGYHLETVRQDFAYDVAGERFVPADKDIDLYRGRATLAYERIAGSWFGAHLDLEYRARSSGSRPTDRRVNEAYVSWGLTDFERGGSPAFGFALGRLAVREAGYAQADGAAVRVRLFQGLNLGAFGGVSGNPYAYNWRLHTTEDFSTDWITGGAFVAFRRPELFANVAGVVTIANFGAGGIDRLSAFLDAGWSATEEIDLFLTGWLDVLPDGRPIQNLELTGAWQPSRDANLRIAVGRFSTLRYALSTAYSFRVDPAGNQIVYVDPATGQASTSTSTAVDENGSPILPFDAAIQVATYNSVRLRGGYRIGRDLEPYATFDLLIRDTSLAPFAPAFSALRLLPGAGLTYQNDALFSADLRVTAVIDDQTETRVMAQAGLSRAFLGFHAAADARVFAGGVFAADGGLELGYTFPRAWLPGRLMLRALFRYFREDVTLARPTDEDQLDDDVVLPVVPLQESFLGFAGVDWKM